LGKGEFSEGMVNTEVKASKKPSSREVEELASVASFSPSKEGETA